MFWKKKPSEHIPADDENWQGGEAAYKIYRRHRACEIPKWQDLNLYSQIGWARYAFRIKWEAIVEKPKAMVAGAR